MLHNRILEIKKEFASITNNPVIDAFNLDECKLIDSKYSSDTFIKEKVDNCLNYLINIKIDFCDKYRSAYEEYTEAITYIELSKKYQTTRIQQTTTQSPDFNIKENGKFSFDIFVEVKSLSFLDGNLNYKAAQESGLAANISIEQQFAVGGINAFAETIISPFLKNNKLPSTRELIEIYIDKINNNLKSEQFSHGDTVLLVDIKQLLLGSNWDESAVALYQEGQTQSIVSGVLWHTAFGQVGNIIYKPIEFEGKENVDSPLTKNGILIDHKFIKGLVFATYKNYHERKYLGFYRHEEQDEQTVNFIASFCVFHNDSMNTEAWSVLQK